MLPAFLSGLDDLESNERVIASAPVDSDRHLYLFSVGEGDVMVFEKKGSH